MTLQRAHLEPLEGVQNDIWVTTGYDQSKRQNATWRPLTSSQWHPLFMQGQALLGWQPCTKSSLSLPMLNIVPFTGSVNHNSVLKGKDSTIENETTNANYFINEMWFYMLSIFELWVTSVNHAYLHCKDIQKTSWQSYHYLWHTIDLAPYSYSFLHLFHWNLLHTSAIYDQLFQYSTNT